MIRHWIYRFLISTGFVYLVNRVILQKNCPIRPIHSTVDKYIESNDEANKDETTSLITGKKIPMILRLENGQELTADTVIHATGWKMNHSFLPPALQEQLVDEKDGQFRLYRWAVNPHLPNIGFVGLNSSFCSVLSSEMIANWLVRYVDGVLTEIHPLRVWKVIFRTCWNGKERNAQQPRSTEETALLPFTICILMRFSGILVL